MKVLINSVRLVGNVGLAPEVTKFENGKVRAKVSLATTEKSKDDGGSWQDRTEWHRLVAWGKLADRFEKIVTKGSRLVVEGKLQHRSYTDSDGQKKSFSEVVVSDFLVIKNNKAADLENLRIEDVRF
jgi:single-strand DNA-binding protein